MVSSEESTAELKRLVDSVCAILVGKRGVVETAVVGMLAEGHILIEDVPGVGKTTLAHALANAISGTFKRIQFTSDILPSDILGVTVLQPVSGEFVFRRGPIFANVVLADEINRATPKTQSALLEAMNERKVTLDSVTHSLPRPFFVFATQNPVEYHGTFPLPESQLDRFFIRLKIGYPEEAEERRILTEETGVAALEKATHVLEKERLQEIIRDVREVAVEDSILRYLLSVVAATRLSPSVHVGVSPRGSLALYRAAQAHAYLAGRGYCVPEDVKSMCMAVLSHRIILKRRFSHLRDHREQAEVVLAEILDRSDVPV